MKILGIDPGTGICGFGVIEKKHALDFGVISTPKNTPLPDRLLDIFNSLNTIIDESKPDVVSIEKLFFTKNITTRIGIIIGAKNDNTEKPLTRLTREKRLKLLKA